MMDAEAVANRSSYWKLAAALQSFLLLLQKKRLGKENEPGGISISLRTSLKRGGTEGKRMLNLNAEKE